MLNWVPDKNLYLAGFMASGKSTAARLLGEQLRIPWQDTDSTLIETAGMSIPDIFARYGEPHFRALERQALQKVASDRPTVVALGGGAILSEVNLRLVKATGALVCLLPSPEVLWRRLRDNKVRPLLFADSEFEQQAKFDQLYRTRLPVYRSAADLLIEHQEEREPSFTVKEILLWLEEQGWITSSP